MLHNTSFDFYVLLLVICVITINLIHILILFFMCTSEVRVSNAKTYFTVSMIPFTMYDWQKCIFFTDIVVRIIWLVFVMNIILQTKQ